MADGWNIYSLELDKDGRNIGSFFQSQGYSIERVNIRSMEHLVLGLSVPRKGIEDLVANAVNTDGKALALSSHGNYHHLAYGLCKRADRISKKYGYIHIDHHKDLFGNGFGLDSENLRCGRFVRAICQDANIGKTRLKPDVLFIGSKVTMLNCLETRQARNFLFTGFVGGNFSEMFYCLDRHLDRLPEEVYVSVDLDVLAPSEARTAFDRGGMKAEKLYKFLQKINARKNIISADIVGYTTSNLPRSAYDGKFGLMEGVRDEEEPSFEQSMGVYKTIADIITGGIK